MTRDQAQAILATHGILDKVAILGYRSRTSQRGRYDDILAILTPEAYTEFKANTLPSKKALGMAVLQPGVYKYVKGLHGIHHLNMKSPADKAIMDTLLKNGHDFTPIPGRTLPYYAFRQAGPVTILRDGAAASEMKTSPDAWPWIDIHKGGYNLTSSEGCQTIYPDRWPEFRDLGFRSMEKYNQAQIKYCLVQL